MSVDRGRAREAKYGPRKCSDASDVSLVTAAGPSAATLACRLHDRATDMRLQSCYAGSDSFLP